ncbi:MAG: tRNA (N(6)-L-threonylcarbamoyladenosine(37)-C(2))-methylthiotransferase MtaB, partial [bacterium]|nr:tRNA (N(6)-L-threonylcarbamoyladenosine(37)-C(2))-methylthiotransferase MtaB [bacterium]
MRESQKRLAVITLGCKTNQYDSFALISQIKSYGYEISSARDSHIAIVNSCAVTGRASAQTRQEIRKIKRENAFATILVTGCYAQACPDELRAMPEIDLIVGNSLKEKIGEIIEDCLTGVFVDGAYSLSPFLYGDPPEPEGRSRALLKIQDGCNQFCSYCIVPFTRGRPQSLPKDKVIPRLKTIEQRGYKETILTGINLAAYGIDQSPPYSLFDLLNLMEREGISQRIRLSSLEPHLIDERLLDFIISSRICARHLHLSIQSGDNEILKRMGRPYTRDFIKDMISFSRKRDPLLSFGADIIVGFPGEGEKEFRNTLSLLEDLDISYLHIFPFSPRPLTEAYNFKDSVKPSETRRRLETLKSLDQKKRRDFALRMLNKNLPCVILEKTSLNGIKRAITTNYLYVQVEDKDYL